MTQPWSKLGIDIRDCNNISNAIKKARLDWSVLKERLITENSGHRTKQYALLRDVSYLNPKTKLIESKKEELGYCTKVYKILQNNVAFDFFNPYIESNQVKLEVAGELKNGKRIWILASINREANIIADNERILKYILLTNSHDGKTGIRIAFIPLRFLCSNMLPVIHKIKTTKFISVRHKANMIINMNKAKDIIDMIDNELNITIGAYKHLTEKVINKQILERYVKTVFNIDPESKNISTKTFNILERVYDKFENGRGNNNLAIRHTLWAAFNAVTEYTNYEIGRNDNNRLDGLWFGSYAKLNSRALDIAMAFYNNAI